MFADKIKAAHKMDLDAVLATCRKINARAEYYLAEGHRNLYAGKIRTLETEAAPLIAAYGQDKAIAMIIN
tara:strand:- start:721 stop:930 length:210 start_codon:yes stop_codon:yes gene_type:complete